MKSRQEITQRREEINAHILSLRQESDKLCYEALMLCDETQQYTEQMKEIGKGKKKTNKVIGTIHWREDFIDESNGEVLTIDRSQTVKIDGEWIV